MATIATSTKTIRIRQTQTWIGISLSSCSSRPASGDMLAVGKKAAKVLRAAKCARFLFVLGLKFLFVLFFVLSYSVVTLPFLTELVDPNKTALG